LVVRFGNALPGVAEDLDQDGEGGTESPLSPGTARAEDEANAAVASITVLSVGDDGDMIAAGEIGCVRVG